MECVYHKKLEEVGGERKSLSFSRVNVLYKIPRLWSFR